MCFSLAARFSPPFKRPGGCPPPPPPPHFQKQTLAERHVIDGDFLNMSIAEFACVVHFHHGRSAPRASSAGEPHDEAGHAVAASLVIKILDLSTGAIIPPPFDMEISIQADCGTIHEVLDEAEQFIEDNFRSIGRRFAVVMAPSALDSIIAECERQDANIPIFFSVAHDAIAAAKSVHPFDSDALEDALTACGIALFDDAAQEATSGHLAQLCKFAFDRGHRFPAALIRKASTKKVNKRAATHVQDTVSKAHAPESKGTADAPASPSSDASLVSAAAMLPISQYCRFRGLPYSASKADIIAFCEDIPVDEEQVHILLAPGGRPSGDAL
jgi:hypothetical protein